MGEEEKRQCEAEKGKAEKEGKAYHFIAFITFRVKPAHNGLSSAVWLGRGPVFLSAIAVN